MLLRRAACGWSLLEASRAGRQGYDRRRGLGVRGREQGYWLKADDAELVRTSRLQNEPSARLCGKANAERRDAVCVRLTNSLSKRQVRPRPMRGTRWHGRAAPKAGDGWKGARSAVEAISWQASIAEAGTPVPSRKSAAPSETHKPGRSGQSARSFSDSAVPAANASFSKSSIGTGRENR